MKGKVSVIFMSKFGDWFLRHPDGSTYELSVIEGTYKHIAATPDEFSKLVNTPDWQEEHLLSQLAAILHEREIIPSNGFCYAFTPHPAWSGRVDIDRVMIMEIGVWQNLCAQTFIGEKGFRK